MVCLTKDFTHPLNLNWLKRFRLGLTTYDPNDNDVADDRDNDNDREHQGPEDLRCAH